MASETSQVFNDVRQVMSDYFGPMEPFAYYPNGDIAMEFIRKYKVPLEEGEIAVPTETPVKRLESWNAIHHSVWRSSFLRYFENLFNRIELSLGRAPRLPEFMQQDLKEQKELDRRGLQYAIIAELRNGQRDGVILGFVKNLPSNHDDFQVLIRYADAMGYRDAR